MRQLCTFLFSLLLLISAQAQTFTGGGGAVPDGVANVAGAEACFPVTVSGVGNINAAFGLSNVCINITHGYVSDLTVFIVSPDGTKIPLTVFDGVDGVNFTNTCFNMTATNLINTAPGSAAPFTGNFRPRGNLGWINNGQNANGVWNLCVQDYFGTDAGSVVNYSITFNNTPAPPAVVAGCSGNPAAGDQCETAVPICNNSSYCGNTSATYSPSFWSTLYVNCFNNGIEIDNNSFLKFVASSTSLSFSVSVLTSLNGDGLQLAFFSGPCQGPMTFQAYASSLAPNTITTLTTSGLTIGETYYIMLDGRAGDVCNYQITPISGFAVVDITPPAATICEGNNTTLVASGGNGTYNWSPATGLNTTTGATVIASPTTTTTYTVTSVTQATAIGCPNTRDAIVTVNPRPATPTATVTTQPTCTTPTGTITVTAPTGANLQYSINGTAYQAGTTFTGVAPGTYNVTVRNTTTTCVSLPLSLTVNATPVPPTAPTASTTAQPTCTVPFGTIIVTAPLGANLEYSINGTAYQSSPTFTNVSAGNYNVTVRNTTTGCVSTATLVVVNTPAGAPAAPTVALVQPSCNVATGTITVNAPTGPTLEYSINGTTYQSATAFNLLAPNTYNVTVRNTVTGCVSPATTVIITAQPLTPAAPTVTLTQPTCTIPTGTITITAPTGATLEYSINGTLYQAGTTFTSVAPGTYNVTVQNNANTCTSPATTVTINTAPAIPTAPTVTITQPTCATPTGSITITAPLGATLEYSINGTTYQPSPTFAGLVANTYNVTVRNTTSTCVSAPNTATINAPIGTPATPTITITQPTCTVTTGTITVNTPTGVNLEYSISGTNYQSSNIFTTVANGSYNVTARNTVTGCVSTATIAVVNAAPAAPAQPAASVTAQPTCTTPTGTISISAPTGASLEYSINGTTYQASTTFTAVAPGTYNVTVRNTASNCVSNPTSVTVNNVAGAPAAPTVIPVQPTCLLNSGTITIAAPLGLTLEYSINGTVYQPLPIFTTVASGTYNVTVRNTISNCVSTGTLATINPALPKSTPPTVTSPEEYCLNETPTTLAAFGNNLLWYTSVVGGIPSLTPPTPVTTSAGTFNYFVTQTNPPNCESDRAAIIVNVYPLPTVTAGIPKTITIAFGQSATLTGTVSSNTISYLWTPILVADTLKPRVTPTVNTTYTLTATSIDGCTASDTVRVNLLRDIIIPNAFSPNGDGVNDKWMIKFIEQYPLSGIEIFNRYGQQIFRSTGYSKPWDGTYNGKPLPVGTYYYIINRNSGTAAPESGSVSIIR